MPNMGMLPGNGCMGADGPAAPGGMPGMGIMPGAPGGMMMPGSGEDQEGSGGMMPGMMPGMMGKAMMPNPMMMMMGMMQACMMQRMQSESSCGNDGAANPMLTAMAGSGNSMLNP